MSEKEFKRGVWYSEVEYIELSIAEMFRSRSEHMHKPDPLVGAVLVAPDGTYFDKAHRGELRVGDHAEFTMIERKNPGVDLTGFTLYTTLEPCVKRNPPKKGCTFRTINARIGRVVIGHIDPDPTVAMNGVRLLEKQKIKVDYYSREYERIIADANKKFFAAAEKRAEQAITKEIQPVLNPLEEELIDFELKDFSEEAQEQMVLKMDLPFNLSTEQGKQAFNTYLNKANLIQSESVENGNKIARPTGLGLLLLGRDPQLKFPQSKVKFTVRPSGQFPLIKDFEGPLVLMPGKIQDYLDSIFPKHFHRTTSFTRDEDKNPTYSGILEVIMNAIIHRDYILSGSKVMVDFYEDKVVVSSPGIPLVGLDLLNNFSAPSVSRNPLITHIFFKMGFVEERGFGLETLSRFKPELGLPAPVFKLENDTLITTVFVREFEDAEALNEVKGLELLEVHRLLTSSEYSVLANVAPRTARRHLSKMVELGLATLSGSGPKTIYAIIEGSK